VKRVVITGVGIISPIGIGKDEFGSALFKGHSGINPTSRYAKDGLQYKAAGDLGDIPFNDHLDPGKTRRFCRASKLALMASYLALQDAGLKPMEWKDPTAIGVILGSAWGCLETTTDFYDGIYKRGPMRANPMLFGETVPNAPTGQISIACGVQGPNITIAQRENSSANGFCTAAQFIQKGRASKFIVGGLDVLTPELFEAYSRLRQVDANGSGPDISAPFDARHTWPILGEGACMMIFEELEEARSRGAHIYGEILGWGMLSSAGASVTTWSTDIEGPSRVIDKSLRVAGIPPEDVDFVCASANSSKVLDQVETAAIKQVLGHRAAKIPVSAPKSMYGDSGVADAFGLAGTLMAMERKLVPPTINYEEPDPACDLDCVPNKARQQEVRIALLNSFGAGGSNASLIVKKEF
jgi:3-oxoacyl-[acyl-carrier-protein] synthase II